MKPFKCKKFEIIQENNPQKIGTDSMLLGAWTAKSLTFEPKKTLDIGTGTGILALMMAQSFESSITTAIEPQSIACAEANLNFRNSDYVSRIMGIETRLQDFGSIDKFDLIICNPPYYDGTFVSDNEERNKARHNFDLSVNELYENCADLISETGRINLIIPITELNEHLERAFDQDLFLQEILHTLKVDGTKKRSVVSFGLAEIDPVEFELLIKDSKGNYSEEYIELTKNFYAKDLKTLRK